MALAVGRAVLVGVVRGGSVISEFGSVNLSRSDGMVLLEYSAIHPAVSELDSDTKYLLQQQLNYEITRLHARIAEHVQVAEKRNGRTVPQTG